MSIKTYKDGKEIILGGPGGEVLPIGTIVDIDSTEIPDGWEKVSDEDTEQQIENLTPHTYTYKITQDISAGTNVTIPCKYIVGKGVLDVYLNGERLILSSDNTGTNGHYLEVGSTDSTSNIIKTTTDWSLSTGDILQLVVRGIYN